VFEDAKVLEPILFVAMPHIWNHIYSEYKLVLEKSGNGKILRFFFHIFVEEKTMQEFSNILGKRLVQIGKKFPIFLSNWEATGGASISSEVLKFLGDCFKCAVANYYGTTESMFFYYYFLNSVQRLEFALMALFALDAP
jgi:long-subunit acyl-CoA synthetase (AMP-forming)